MRKRLLMFLLVGIILLPALGSNEVYANNSSDVIETVVFVDKIETSDKIIEISYPDFFDVTWIPTNS